MAGSNNLVGQFSFPPGVGLVDGSQLAALIALLFSSKSGIVALTGGGAAGTPLTAAVNNIDTVVTNNDSVVMPPATSIGQQIVVNNNGAATLAVFGSGTDTILASGSVGAGAASVTQATGVAKEYFCTVVGIWKQLG